MRAACSGALALAGTLAGAYASTVLHGLEVHHFINTRPLSVVSLRHQSTRLRYAAELNLSRAHLCPT